MADELAYTGPIDIRDPELFTPVTDITQMNLYSRKGGTRKLIEGQVVANEAIAKGDISELSEMDGTAGNVLDPANDVVIIQDTSSNTNKKVIVANLAGTSLSTYSLLANRVHVTGSAGITAALAGGVLTITIPASGILTGGSFDFTAADATYSNGTLISDAIKIRFDNTATSATFPIKMFAPIAFAKTAGTINGTSPANINSSLILNGGTDEHGGGITSFFIKDVPSNASAGGIISF